VINKNYKTMKTLEKLIQRHEETIFEKWNDKHGIWDRDYVTHPDTNAVLAVNSDILNLDEYVAHVQENRQEIIEDLIEVVINDDEFREFLFNKFLETI